MNRSLRVMILIVVVIINILLLKTSRKGYQRRVSNWAYSSFVREMISGEYHRGKRRLDNLITREMTVREVLHFFYVYRIDSNTVTR